MKQDPDSITGLALFPLQAVLFPDGLLRLRVFEARYLDLISRCLRDHSPFGVVCLKQGSEVRGDDEVPVRLESVGVLASLLEVDAEQSGILKVSCRGGLRFRMHSPGQRHDGLWLADALPLPGDAPVPPPANLRQTVAALTNAIEALRAQGQQPFVEPHRLDDAGWVANRWCELLPISLQAKQRLMELEDPIQRLTLVDEYLRGKGVF